MKIPVGRIEYLGTNGTVGETANFFDEKKFVKRILEENYSGASMAIVIYRDANGKTIDQSFLAKLDPPVAEVKVENAPDEQIIKALVSEMMTYAEKAWEIGDSIMNICGGYDDEICEILTQIQECSLTESEEAVKEILDAMEEADG